MPNPYDELIANKQKYPDSMEVPFGDAKFTLGELRAHEAATGESVAKQMADLEKQRKQLEDAQAQVVEVWTKLEADKNKAASAQPAAPSDWRSDPFFAPLTKDYAALEAQVKQAADNYANVQKALAAGVKYIVDRFVDYDYRSLPEDFRKETPLEQAVRIAQERKYLDAGGVPDVRKAYQEWAAPRNEERIRKEAYDKARADLERDQRTEKIVAMKPGFVGTTQTPGAPPSKDFSEALAKAFNDPEIVAGLR